MTKVHSFLQQYLHDLQFMKTRSSSPNLSKLAPAGISWRPCFHKLKKHCLRNEWILDSYFVVSCAACIKNLEWYLAVMFACSFWRAICELPKPIALKFWTEVLNLGRATITRPVVPRCAGCAMAHPDFGRSVNPISTRGDGLCPPIYYWHTQIFRPSDGPDK